MAVEFLFHILLEALQTRVTRSGSTHKVVVCERCQTRFEYEMSRTATEKGFASAEELGLSAEAKLQRMLEEGCDPHPCPGCGYYQRAMARRLKRAATGHIPYWIVGLVLLSGAFFFLALTSAGAQNPGPAWFTYGFVLAGAGCMLVVIGFCAYRISKRFSDPNAERGYVEPE